MSHEFSHIIRNFIAGTRLRNPLTEEQASRMLKDYWFVSLIERLIKSQRTSVYEKSGTRELQLHL